VLTLFEQAISLHQDYTDIHSAFDDHAIVSAIEKTLHGFREELNIIGYAIQFNSTSKAKP
jgi:hypothetical protein